MKISGNGLDSYPKNQEEQLLREVQRRKKLSSDWPCPKKRKGIKRKRSCFLPTSIPMFQAVLRCLVMFTVSAAEWKRDEQKENERALYGS